MRRYESFFIQLAKQLANYGLISFSEIEKLNEEAKQHNTSLINHIAQKKIISGEKLAHCIHTLLGVPIASIENISDEMNEQSFLNARFLQQFKIIPLKKINQTLDIAMIDPTDASLIDAVAFQSGLTIRVHVIAYETLEQWLDHTFFRHANHSNDLIEQIDLEHENEIEELDNQDEPLIQLVDDIIVRAQQQSASDIHIEPFDNSCRIRYRQHGVLHIINEMPKRLVSRITTRLKVMARLDISEKRLPQDGRFRFKETDIRINTCPVMSGEKIVLRLLNNQQKQPDISELGMDIMQQQLFEKTISQPQGMILVTGPTGSGKTITLYAALSYLNKSEKNISTVEDPVEIQLPGINQININAKIGLTFAKILRALLRQDPDIIMLGEIRDTETAEIAIQAAQTGHFVLSTLHTNSAIDAVSRLQSMQIPAGFLTDSIRLIIAQRLVRTLCTHCRIRDTAIPTLFQSIKMDTPIIFRAQGCQKCYGGFNGRTAIYEFLPIDETISEAIQQKTSKLNLLQIAEKNGFKNLISSGLEKVQCGITSLSELTRVLSI